MMKYTIPVSVLAFVAMVSGVLPLGAVEEPQQADMFQPNQVSPPDGQQPTPVRAAFHLQSIHHIDDESETFRFSGVLTLIWKDARQAFDPNTEGVAEKFYNGAIQFNELSPSWYPQVVLANATEIDDPQGVLLRVKPDSTSTLVQTLTAEVRSRPNLRRYPFDNQTLEAIFYVLGFDDSEVLLTAENW